ncbi:MAG: aldo/keto reductase [Verrucomicrobia bacterium]|nr:aldo/keto reductase [Verrucomicrobiota bacterium]
MNAIPLSRRAFIAHTAALTGSAVLSPLGLRSAPAAKRTAVDQVPLGKTGLKLSRLGIGTGSNSGQVQHALGKEGFVRLVRHAYDRGITYIDAAQSYRTFEWIKDAIRGLPREKLFLQSKIGGQPEKVAEVIDRHRKVFDTDYLDSLLIHCMVREHWTDAFKRVMDAFDAAREKKLIRAKGVSCHSIPALRAATASDWTEVHLVRVNPQGHYIDSLQEHWDRPGRDLEPVMHEVRTMHAKGRGVIGMKIIGNGDFTRAEDREKSIRWAMSRPELSAVVIGFKSAAEIDEAIERMNRALAEA